MPIYRVFVKDVGPVGQETGYSAICDVDAESSNAAVEKIRSDQIHSWDKRDMRAFLESDRDSWPDGRTGELKGGA